MSHTDAANYPECLTYREPEGEAKTRRLERLADLHERMNLARKTRGPARIHYTLAMMTLSRSELVTLGIPPDAIEKHCPQFKPDGTKHFNLANTLREHAKCKPNPRSRKQRRF